MICIGITTGIGPSGAPLHTIGIGTIIGIGIGVGQWKCTITTLRRKQVELLKTVIFTSRMLLLDRARPNRWGYRHNQVQTEFCTEL